MSDETYAYVIVGGGLAGASAVEGIRERDEDGSIVLIGAEDYLPYNRPPLSKDLWLKDKDIDDTIVHDEGYYKEQGVALRLGTRIVGLDAGQKIVTDEEGSSYSFDKLLLATGGVPRRLPIPGSDLEGIFYYRTLAHYERLREEVVEGKTAVIIGGGFIGSEMAAALTMNGVKVTMIFPEPYLVQRVFPEGLGRALQKVYEDRGMTVMTGDKPAALSRSGIKYHVRTESGGQVEADLIVAGIGIVPATDLAEGAGLKVDDGIVVNEYLQSSHPDIYAAGDNARFPYPALDKRMRIEHWNNAEDQGKWAGGNMAGAGKPFDHMPYFYSDLFEFGYEAVGEVDSRLETLADWEKENDTGVIYYLKEGKVRGVMLCNVWGKLDAARALIRKGEARTAASLRGAIRA
jgi:3-phenylpropionate/trans-cinnamate dioxygenase ferredoxin reductase subunit